MKVLGVDPGYERLGIAILEKGDGRDSVLYSACFKTKKSTEFAERLNQLGEEIGRIIKEYKPEVLAIETLFLNTNHKTAMRVAEVRGVIINEGEKQGLELFEASPPQVKLATAGYGRADKEQMKKMVNLLVELEDRKR